MSLAQEIEQSIIRNIVTRLSEHYGLDVEEAMAVVATPGSKAPITPPAAEKRKLSRPAKPATPEVPKDGAPISVSEDPVDLAKYSAEVLKAICKAKNLRFSGTKTELLNRILDANRAGPSGSSGPDVKSEAKAEPKSKAKAAAKKPEPSILKKLTQTASKIVIKRNSFDNYEHVDTHFVFNRDDQIVIGKQMPDGMVIDLDDDDIETCKKYNFDYRIPENLDKNKKNDDPVIDEMIEEELAEDDFEEDAEEALSEEEVDDE
jgi:hypothetical protein